MDLSKFGNEELARINEELRGKISTLKEEIEILERKIEEKSFLSDENARLLSIAIIRGDGNQIADIIELLRTGYVE